MNKTDFCFSCLIHCPMVRFKSRYLVVTFSWPTSSADTTLDETVLVAAIREQLATRHGQHGLLLSQGSLQVKYFNPLTSMGLVRCARDQLGDVRAAVEALRMINGKQVIAQITLVSGTMARCQASVQAREASLLTEARLTDKKRKLAHVYADKLAGLEV